MALTRSDRPLDSRPARRRAPLLWLALGGSAVVAGCVVLAISAGGPGQDASSGDSTSASGEVAAPPSYSVAPTPRIDLAPRTASPYAGPPQRVIVPALGIDAPVVGIDVAGGVLNPPADPQTLGWWRGGAPPGAATGGALITGHTVHSGGGAMDDLERLRPGDRVTVRTERGDVRYSVTGVEMYRKQSLAQHAADVFSQHVPGRLVLVTCEDWNGSVYLSNVVVVAEPV